MADHGAIELGDQRQHKIAAVAQPRHKVSLLPAAEGGGNDRADGGGVFRFLGADDHRILLPLPTRVPRTNASADMGLPPSLCSWTIRMAPSPHATVRSRSRISPGSPLPAASSQRRTFSRTGSALSSISLHAPGKGDNPWQ